MPVGRLLVDALCKLAANSKTPKSPTMLMHEPPLRSLKTWSNGSEHVAERGIKPANQGEALMVRRMLVMLVCGMMVTAFAFTALADDAKVTPQQVKQLVEKAVNLIAEKGEAVAFPLLSDPNGEYVEGDLYVFTYNMDGTIVQHLKPKLVGMNMMNTMDKKGKCLACDFVRVAKEEGAGWSEYWWPKPSTNEVAVKTSYIMKVPGKDLLVGAGVYDLTKEQAEAAVK